MTEERKTDWAQRAGGGYEKLGWVSASNLLGHITELTELKGHEVIVDVGTGSQAVLNTLSPFLTNGGVAIGFDMSSEMLARKDTSKSQNLIFLGDAKGIPLPDSVADVVTARMVLHHIPECDLPKVVSEMSRIAKSEARIVVCEYVALDQEVWEFERGVFNIKEPERHLWTGPELRSIVQSGMDGRQMTENSLSYAILPQYSVKDWMGKSGLPQDKQQAVLEKYLSAPGEIVEKMGISYTQDNDALVDRLFAYVLTKTN